MRLLRGCCALRCWIVECEDDPPANPTCPMVPVERRAAAHVALSGAAPHPTQRMGGRLSSAAAGGAGGTLVASATAHMARRRLVLAARHSWNRDPFLPRPPQTHATRACSDAFGRRRNASIVHGDHAARGRTRDSTRTSTASPHGLARALRRIGSRLSRSLSPALAQHPLRSSIFPAGMRRVIPMRILRRRSPCGCVRARAGARATPTWPIALAKLTYVDSLMHDLHNVRPSVTSRDVRSPSRRPRAPSASTTPSAIARTERHHRDGSRCEARAPSQQAARDRAHASGSHPARHARGHVSDQEALAWRAEFDVVSGLARARTRGPGARRPGRSAADPRRRHRHQAARRLQPARRVSVERHLRSQHCGVPRAHRRSVHGMQSARARALARQGALEEAPRLP